MFIHLLLFVICIIPYIILSFVTNHKKRYILISSTSYVLMVLLGLILVLQFLSHK